MRIRVRKLGKFNMRGALRSVHPKPLSHLSGKLRAEQRRHVDLAVVVSFFQDAALPAQAREQRALGGAKAKRSALLALIEDLLDRSEEEIDSLPGQRRD